MPKLTKEEIEQKLQEIWSSEEWIQKCEWEDGEDKYSAWKVKVGDKGYMYTNNAGMEQIHQAMKKELENYKTDGKAKKSNKKW